jgi:general secretion pathway protein E
MPHERERSSSYTLSQQVKAVLNQRLVRTLCQGCAHTDKASNYLSESEVAELGISPGAEIKRHNTSGCDLCSRTGISGRTLLLDALLITLGPGQRNGIYEAMMNNLNMMPKEEGVISHTRRDGLVDLVLSGLVDPKAALSHLED